MITRIYVEKKSGFDVERQKLLKDIQMNVHVDLEDMRLINVYDVKNLNEENKDKVINTVFSEPNVDEVYEQLEYNKEKAFRIKLLPGQFDQRADSAKQCIEIVTLDEGVVIESSKLYILQGDVNSKDLEKIKDYLINPVENTEVSLDKPKDIGINQTEVEKVQVIEGFITFNEQQMEAFLEDMAFAMDLEDILFIQEYFKSEERNPTITELKVLDTYWSDHCRHTTFLTTLESIHFEDGPYHALYKNTFNRYLEIREELNRTKAINLMDLATIMMKYQHAQGNLDNLDISEEVNASSIEVTVDVDGEDQDYLVMFKNETHNHPTEIEPFGGAATCLGGAIRDPLSGRAYVYQGMRVTGSADPRTPIEKTLDGKLPQRIITQKAAKGFSSYGNQIGLPSGLIDENYDENFVAKRMEVGAVVGATPAEEVKRERPTEGDLILLIGGKTGRDGCGGATGSSKKHTEESILTSGAEVQKGNAPEERKLQRLYRNPEFSKRIKRSNDFGAGGVSVAIGEIADSIEVNLDKVPKKYDGLDGTELAISESQERMAIVIDKSDLEVIEQLCEEENVEATVVAKVTDTNRFIMKWQGETIFDISRDFIKTSGVNKKARVKLTNPKENIFDTVDVQDVKNQWYETLQDLNVCSKKGLVEMFDNTVGANTVLMPFGGKTYNTPTQTMVAKIPVEGETNTCTIMTYGYNPKLGKWSTFHSGVYNVLSSIAKIVSTGGKYEDIRFSFQEYFERLGNDPEKWGKPFSALLGTILVQDAFNLAAIGGKDSMSGTFNEINVPPTLISFAIAPSKVESIISPELKASGNYIYKLKTFKDQNLIPDFDQLKQGYEQINEKINAGKILSAYSLDKGKLAGALTKMAFGNEIGVAINESMTKNELFTLDYGSIVFESTEKIDNELFELVGHTIDEKVIKYNELTIDLKDALKRWSAPLEEVFPTEDTIEGDIKAIKYVDNGTKKSKKTYEQPRVLIPSFPGTNCEIDTKLAFEKVGAKANVVIFKNQDKDDINQSIATIVEEIKKSQIIAFPGGFSAGDEPDGSGKFIASVFRHPRVKEAIDDFLNKDDGLIIGICNGFQALIKLGLLPYGEIRELTEHSPTLTFNKIGRHISKIAKVKMTSNKSPWLKLAEFDTIYETPLSHGEGRFYADDEVIEELIKNGQIATRYVDDQGNPTYDGKFNPNGSIQAVEGLTSKDGRIFGKMGHVERLGDGLLKNIYAIEDMKLFKSGVDYFKK